jgi:hypothetical protein
MARKVVKLSVVRNRRVKDNVKVIKDDLLDSVKKSLVQLGDDLAGYALVMWAKTDGDPVVSYNADMGPIGPGMLVSHVNDALSRAITFEMLNPGDGGEDTGET